MYFENLFTWYFADMINPNVLSTTGLATYAWTGDANGNGVVDAGEYNPSPLRVFTPKNNSVDENLKDPKTHEIMAEYQRELAPNVGLSVSYFQRWFTDNWADVNVGIPTTAYVPRTVVDPGADNFITTADDRTISMYDVSAAYVGKDAFKRQTVPGTTNYKSVEVSMTRRMTNNWQLQGSYVWSRLDGAYWIGTRQLNDPTNPNEMIDTNHLGRGGQDQPHAFKLIGNYRAPYDINVGINWQMLSGLPIQRELRQSLITGGHDHPRRPERNVPERQPEAAVASRRQELPPPRNAPSLGIRGTAQRPERELRAGLRHADSVLDVTGAARRGQRGHDGILRPRHGHPAAARVEVRRQVRVLTTRRATGLEPHAAGVDARRISFSSNTMTSTSRGSGISGPPTSLPLVSFLAFQILGPGSGTGYLAAPAPVSSPGGIREPAWSPDGKRIAVSYLDRIWTAAPDGRQPRPLTTAAAGIEREPSWSPDGRTIAFSADAGQGFHLYTAPAGGGAPTRVTALAGDERWPSWTRDGRVVFAYRAEPTGEGDWSAFSRRPGPMATSTSPRRQQSWVLPPG